MAITTQESGNAYVEYVGDGTIKGAAKEFPIPFDYISHDHIKVLVDGVLKVYTTDYTINADAKSQLGGVVFVVFVTAPGNGAVVTLKRVTPEAMITLNPERGDPLARQAFFIAQERADLPVIVELDIPATELSAGTLIEAIAPCDGEIRRARGIVQTAIVSGGGITFQIATTTIVGADLTVADSATKGTKYAARLAAGVATAKVRKGDRITATAAAAFNGGGAVKTYLEIKAGVS